MAQSKGERIIRTSFNPSGDSDVEALKGNFATLFDIVDQICPATERSERRRCIAIALTHLETSAMYAVKGLTASRDE